MRKKPTWIFALIRTTTFALLLITLGLIMGFRYANEGSLFGLKITLFDNLAQKTQSTNLSNLMDSSGDTSVSMSTFWEVWQLVERDYLNTGEIDENKMINGAISGMVTGLGDPYTMYLAPEDNSKAEEDLAGSFYGVGIELTYIDGMVGIISPLVGSPGEKAGLLAGDVIIHVKDESKGLDEDTTEWTLDDAVKNIRGPKNTPVILTIYRKSDNSSQEISVLRDEIIVKSVTLEFIEVNGKQIANLKLSKFGERTLDEWNDAVAQILSKKNQIAGLVLDLRNNPGGFFDVSIDVASDFVKSGVVVSQESKYNTKNYNSTGKARLVGIPTVVLVNKGSASASEIVAGALRDDAQIKLIGEKTFGKGTVQDRRELSNGGGLHITVGRWLTPDGNWIHKDGLAVDVEVVQNYDTTEDEVLLKAVEQF
ncbi:S41 family peptidase [Patescibacteria group bacterium]|nr:S41 family peptidase [Patescibacteria group bacterium]